MFLGRICASEGVGFVQKQLEAKKRREKSSVRFSFVSCNQSRSPQIYSHRLMTLQKNTLIHFWNVQIFPFSFYLYLKLFVFNQPSWAAKLNSNVTFFLYFALKPDPLILICQSQPSVPQAILKNCARDWSISTIWNHEPLHVLKRTVTLLNGFQPLGLQIKEGVLQLANQGEYIGLQITTYLHL